MDLRGHHTTLRDLAFPSESLLPPPPPPASFMSPFFPRSNSSSTSFPILAVAVIGILATAFLLVSYYVFVIKCCLNWHRIDLLRRFSISLRRNDQDPLMAYSPELRSRGLDESAIRAIPIFKFKKRNLGPGEDKSSQECSVCLNEFQEDEKLRIIPNCCHLFHIDCIDVWLQNNANCPLCRTSVSCHESLPPDRISAPSSSPEDPNPNPNPHHESVVGDENDFVVIELGNSHNTSSRNQSLLPTQERMNSGGVNENTPRSISPSLRKIDRGTLNKKGRKFRNVTSMGDECIDITRDKDDQFSVQPIRRSISMDSSADRQLYLAVQEAINRQASVPGDVECSSGGTGNSSNRVKRSFFSFGSRGSRSSVLPLYLEP